MNDVMTEAGCRQHELYNFLLKQDPAKWITQEQCTDSISAYPAFFVTEYHDSAARMMLTKDIRAINADAGYEKIILSGKHGIKLATEEEAGRWLKAEFKEVFRKLARIRKIQKKCGLDGQYELDGHTIDAFLQEESNG